MSNPPYQETKLRLHEYKDKLRAIAHEIAWIESAGKDGYCSQKVVMAIIHLNKAREEIETALDVLNGKYDSSMPVAGSLINEKSY